MPKNLLERLGLKRKKKNPLQGQPNPMLQQQVQRLVIARHLGC